MADLKKQSFVKNLVRAIAELARVRDKIESMKTVYIDREYAGANIITDEDLNGVDVNASDVVEMSSILTDFSKFVKNDIVKTADRSITLSKFREDV